MLLDKRITLSMKMLIGLLLMGSMGLVGCAKKEKAAISFWHSMADEQAAAINEIAHEFETLNPGISVQPIYQGSYDQLHQKLIAAITSRTTPALAQMYESWTSQFLSRNLLAPVQEFFQGPDGLSQEEIEDIVKAFRENNSWDGRMVTMPFNKSAYVLYVNADMLERAGLDHPPQTWDELREAAKKMTVRKDDRTEVYGFAIRPFIESLTTLYYMNGGRYLAADRKTLLLDSPEAHETLQFLVDLVQKDKVAYIESDYLSNAFGSERIAMYIGSTASFPYNDEAVGDKFHWEAAALPRVPGKEPRVLFQGTNVGIFRQPSEDETRAAWKFVKFLTNTQNATKWAIATGYLPTRYSVLNMPDMKAYLEKNPNYRVAVSQLDNGVFEPREVYWESMRLVITDQVEAALNGRKSVDEAMKEAVEKCRFELDMQ
jgi:multiple sugar transport system substrate-binding protein